MSLPETMQAIQIKEFNAPYAVSKVAVPKPKPNQLLIRIKAAGFCHTDLMALNNEFNSPLPYIGSHEGAGVVEEVGSNVQGFAKGDHVGCINFDSSCGECPDCSTGRVIYCDQPQMKGLTIDGAWAEYMVADARTTVKIPESVDLITAAPLMCAGLSIYGGIKKAGVPPGGSIGIIGIGGLGHIGTQLSKAMGYKVAAVDIKQTSLDLVNSHRLKPDISLLATEDPKDAMAKVHSAIPGKFPGLDATVLATDQQSAFDFAAAITRKHGTVVLLGQPDKGISMSFYNMIFRDIKLVGSLIGDTSDADELMQLVNDHDIQLKIKTWNLDQAEEMRQEYLSEIHLSTSSMAINFDNDKRSPFDLILIFAADQTPPNTGPGWKANKLLGTSSITGRGIDASDKPKEIRGSVRGAGSIAIGPERQDLVYFLSGTGANWAEADVPKVLVLP